MKKVKIDKISGYQYILVDLNKNYYSKNIDFFSNYKPQYMIQETLI